MSDASGPAAAGPFPTPFDLERIAIDAAVAAAGLVRAAHGEGRRAGLTTKSSPTDIVTQTDLDSERLIHRHLVAVTPDAGFVGEEATAQPTPGRLQWIVDPLDGTVNFHYGLPVVAVSVGAAIDGRVVAGAVVDVFRNETFSAAIGHGARLDGDPITVSDCPELGQALVTTGFSYRAALRATQGEVVTRVLPQARDVRCFGSAALQLCWVGCGRVDAYFERDIKLWDHAAGSFIAGEAGARVELPCPENEGLTIAGTPKVFDALLDLVDSHDITN